ncbi:hypothetical protein ETAA8_42820 [Anatilimnocola aggregata]|uniref:Uncharacterized protein n=1 Tax=Anatilimnocola aggregata TaxID=2528021 RepID=A0A517YG10_9BACT|nr:hypothetical protein [Anatilimnocola aggregata]QDU29175.1 hypothetical protein ETAA8_42820 [Anatilimnocola aggregata]
MRIALFTLLLFLVGTNVTLAQDQQLIVVVGASGGEEFEQPFREWAQRWTSAGKSGKLHSTVIGLDSAGETTDRERLKQTLEELAAKSPVGPIWLALIGHGTFDGKTARFNLRGPDLSTTELKEMLKPLTGPVAVVDCSSCSGPFLAELSAPQRVVITATKSGHEYNFARFGEFLSTSIADPAADLDKDEQTSLLEAYLAASAKLREFYAREARLATEHALLDDNGDRLGTPADWFQGLRVVKQTKAGAPVDGSLASQFVLVRSEKEQAIPAEIRRQRELLEKELAELRASKANIAEADYFTRLEHILVQLAKLSRSSAGK